MSTGVTEPGGGKALEIRCIGADLEAALAVFFEELARAGDEAVFHPHPLTAEQAVAIARRRGADLYYALVKGGEVLGYGVLRGWEEGFAIPSLGIAIAPRHRGRGLGRLLMAFLHEAARLQGAAQVRLKVYAANTGAMNLYRRLGYVFRELGDGQLLGILDLSRPPSG